MLIFVILDFFVVIWPIHRLQIVRSGAFAVQTPPAVRVKAVERKVDTVERGAVAAAFQAFADDAVGVMRVDVSSNETVLAAIPFHPLPTNSVDAAIAGGNGEMCYADSQTGEIFDLAPEESGWVGADDGLPPALFVKPGDSFTLFPAGGGVTFK